MKKQTKQSFAQMRVHELRLILGVVILELLENTQLRDRMMNLLKAKHKMERQWCKKELEGIFNEMGY